MKKTIDSVIKNIAYSRAMRYFGRGFSELLLPIFIFSFVSNYTETGILVSVYNITSLIVLPIIGYFADKFWGKKLLILSLLLYPLIWISYFFSGILHLTIFIIIAKIINWITRSLYTIGEKMYIRKYAHEEEVSTSMGYVGSIWDIIRTLWALLGVLIIYTTPIPMYYLFLAVIPTALYSLIYINRLPAIDENESYNSTFNKTILLDSYKEFRTILLTFTGGLKTYTILYFLINLIESAIWLIIPIYFYIETQNIFLVVLSGLLVNMPNFFSYNLWKLADQYKTWWLILWFFILAISFVLFIVTPVYWIKIFILLIISFAFVFLGLSIDWLSNKFIRHDMYGRSEAMFELIRSIWSILWVVLGGLYIDTFGSNNLFIFTSIFSLLIMLYTYLRLWQLR